MNFILSLNIKYFSNNKHGLQPLSSPLHLFLCTDRHVIGCYVCRIRLRHRKHGDPASGLDSLHETPLIVYS